MSQCRPARRVFTGISHFTCCYKSLHLFLCSLTTMPRKPPAVVIRNQYSKDLKNRVIYQAFTLEKKSTQIAIDLNMSLRVVQRAMLTWRELREVCWDLKHKGCAPLMSPNTCNVWVMMVNLTVTQVWNWGWMLSRDVGVITGTNGTGCLTQWYVLLYQVVNTFLLVRSLVQALQSVFFIFWFFELPSIHRFIGYTHHFWR